MILTSPRKMQEYDETKLENLKKFLDEQKSK
jgi:hypothetical protein